MHKKNTSDLDLTTKLQEGHEGFGCFYNSLRALRITIVESFRGLRKLSGGPWLSKRGFARAKTPKTPSPEV
jgi:hypothetical protein